MADTPPWQILVVDDDEDTRRQVRDALHGESAPVEGGLVQVETLGDFDQALGRLEAHRFDLLILDLRLGPHETHGGTEDEAGIRTLQAIKETLFVPVVFYTGLPNLVQHLQTPLIRVVEKTEGVEALIKVVGEIFATRLPAVNRALIRHVESVQRDYMWDFVAENWNDFGNATDRTGLAYLLARRLARSLSALGVQQLTRDLGDPTGEAVAEGRVHPMEYYIMPPLDELPALAGDLFHGEVKGDVGFWILLTPSCDLALRKADWVLLARSFPLQDQEEYKEWREGLPEPSKGRTRNLEALLKNNRSAGQSDRYHFLPGTLSIPDLVVDFQQMVTCPCDELHSLERLASLDSPFAEAVLARFTRYFGRMGTPDLDIDFVLSRLTSATGDGEEQ